MEWKPYLAKCGQGFYVAFAQPLKPKTRSFEVVEVSHVDGRELPSGGKFRGKTPQIAARRMVRSTLGVYPDAVVVSLLETTKGSKNKGKVYTYEVARHPKTQPCVVTRGGKTITFRYDYTVFRYQNPTEKFIADYYRVPIEYRREMRTQPMTAGVTTTYYSGYGESEDDEDDDE